MEVSAGFSAGTKPANVDTYAPTLYPLAPSSGLRAVPVLPATV